MEDFNPDTTWLRESNNSTPQEWLPLFYLYKNNLCLSRRTWQEKPRELWIPVHVLYKWIRTEFSACDCNVVQQTTKHISLDRPIRCYWELKKFDLSLTRISIHYLNKLNILLHINIYIYIFCKIVCINNLYYTYLIKNIM